MFGYIKPFSPELRVKEFELYKAVYCGLCDSLGKKVSRFSRLSLSYDFVFLAIIRMALMAEKGKVKRKRCIAHPLKKRNVITGSRELDTTAALSSVLIYYKVKDDIADSRGLKKLLAYTILPAASRMRKKAKIEGACEGYITKKLSALSALESEGCDSLDRVAEPFGELMARISSYDFDEKSSEGRIAAEIGRHIGRFIYIIDAIDDFSDDIKSNSYNPFRRIYGDDVGKFSADADIIKDSLTMILSAASNGIELIDFSDFPEFGEIIRNIIYIALPKLCDKIISKYTDKINGEETR